MTNRRDDSRCITELDRQYLSDNRATTSAKLQLTIAANLAIIVKEFFVKKISLKDYGRYAQQNFVGG